MIIVGKKKFLKKDKSANCYVVTVLVDYSENQKANGCLGLAAKDVFISETYFNSLTENDFNRECIFDYDMNSSGSPEPCGHRFANENKMYLF